MSDAPERIWAFEPDIFDNMSVWQDLPSPAGDTVEYIRADLVDPLSDPHVKVLAELLREASCDLENYVDADWPADLRAKYPAYQRKWERDMDLCNRIDAAMRATFPAALAEINEGGDT